MSDTILRHLAMLSLVPARPGKTTVSELHARLLAQGFETHVRSIERDLHKLSRTFPLASDEGRPAGWQWASGEPRVTFPAMDPETALTYELVSRYLAPVLPRGMLRLMEPEFAQARHVLDMYRASPLGRWSRRVAVLPFGQQLLPPDVRPGVSEVVYEALLKGRRFEADYRPADTDESRRYVLNPLGMVYREGVLYLVATLWDYDDARHLALQRMANAQLLEADARAPAGFDFERYIREDKSFDYRVGPDVRLELRVQSWLKRHLEECRLSKDQQIVPLRGSDDWRVTATVADTDQLFWWLRSLGDSVEVRKPGRLRRRMAGHAMALASMYEGDT